ncbi:MAG: TolC family outer membrane protein [Gammaproteobacteria bacterium]
MAKPVKRFVKQYAVSAVTIAVLSTIQQASAEDLWDTYQLALQNDATYLAAAESYEAALLNLPLAKTGFRPYITTFGTLGRQRSDITGPRETRDDNRLIFDLDQPIYDRALSIGIDQAELEAEIARITFEDARDDLTIRLAESYFSLLGFRDLKEVARLQKITIKRQMELAEERLDVGLGTRTDLFDARARFQQADADLIEADILINNARQALIEIINVVPRSIAPLADDSPLDPPEPNDLDHWVGLSSSNNLLVLTEDINLLVASKEIDRQRAARRPTISIGASQAFADSGDNGFLDGDTSTTSVGIDLDLPIYLGGSINLRTRQAGLQFNAVEQRLELSKRRAASDTTSAFLDVTSGISQVEALAEAIIAGENALQAKEEGFSAGLTTNIDVLDAQRDLSRSRTDFLSAKYSYILALLRLERATGDLGDEDILYINEWLVK